jgi:hypothetical protein
MGDFNDRFFRAETFALHTTGAVIKINPRLILDGFADDRLFLTIELDNAAGTIPAALRFDHGSFHFLFLFPFPGLFFPSVLFFFSFLFHFDLSL